jgi:membrane-bound lytic murein transglycosylase D
LFQARNCLVSKTEQPVAASEPEKEKVVPEKIEVSRTEPAATFKTPEEVKQEIRTTASLGNEFHVVQGGQTYYSISKAYGLTIKDLFALNNLDDSDRLKSGQRLRVRKADGNDSASEAVNQNISSGVQTHTVAPGETLFRISQTYHINVEDIKKLNNMSGNSVIVGQKLKIPQQ